MPIRVTCAKCHTRFDVGEQHAGKEGPCPKCKSLIRIPTLEEQVVIHEPELAGPKDSKGRLVLKPIGRVETNLTAIHWTIIAVTIVGFIALAFFVRMSFESEQDIHTWMLALGALAVAPPTVLAAYSFMRDQELGFFNGRELWLRIGACSVAYALTWLAMPLMEYTFDEYNLLSIGIGVAAMIGAGGALGMLALDFDYLIGCVHYGMYLGCCILMRLIAGMGFLPGTSQLNEQDNSAAQMLIDHLQTVLA
jgi:hypothetical protein